MFVGLFVCWHPPTPPFFIFPKHHPGCNPGHVIAKHKRSPRSNLSKPVTPLKFNIDTTVAGLENVSPFKYGYCEYVKFQVVSLSLPSHRKRNKNTWNKGFVFVSRCCHKHGLIPCNIHPYQKWWFLNDVPSPNQNWVLRMFWLPPSFDVICQAELTLWLLLFHLWSSNQGFQSELLSDIMSRYPNVPTKIWKRTKKILYICPAPPQNRPKQHIHWHLQWGTPFYDHSLHYYHEHKKTKFILDMYIHIYIYIFIYVTYEICKHKYINVYIYIYL